MHAYWDRLSWRGRATWLAHLFKACAQQHHREMIPLFRALLPPDGVVVDAGAHAGQFAKLFARLMPKGHVHAFEPSGYARSILHHALRVNRLPHIQIHALGLSDAAGEVTLNTPVKRSGSAGFGTASLGTLAAAHTIAEPVPVRPLDALWPALGADRLDLIKADIEGWEMRLLAGARDCLARFRPALLIELSPDALSRAGDDVDDVWDLLTPLGYRAYLKHPTAETWHPGRPAAAADVLWLTERHAGCLDPDGVPQVLTSEQ